MSLLCGFALCGLAWVLLSLGLPKHFQALRGRAPTSRERRALRGTGWVTLVAGFTLCIAALGWEYGPVFWLAMLMLSAVAWVPMLAWFGGK